MKHLFSHQQWQTGQLWSPTMVTLPGWSHAAASNRQNMEHALSAFYVLIDHWAIKKMTVRSNLLNRYGRLA